MKKFFVLGGNDAEMTVIAGLLAQAGQKFVQPNKGWGDHVFSPEVLGLDVVPAHEDERENRRVVPAKVAGYDHVVFVECKPVEGWPEGTPVVIVDHHNENAGRPASVLQVLGLLRQLPGEMVARSRAFGSECDKINVARDAAVIEAVVDGMSSSTRRFVELVAANDAGYIPAMLALGATPEEVGRVRALERSCQGVTPEQEAAAEVALAAPAEFVGPYRVVRLAHSKCATVTDRLFRSGQPERILVLSEDGEANLFGDGATCAALKEKFEGWAGGSGLGKAEGQAYWGGHPPHGEVVEFLKERFSS